MNVNGKRIGLLGARGQSGRSVLRLLVAAGAQISAFSRDPAAVGDDLRSSAVAWYDGTADAAPSLDGMVCAIPIWELPRYFHLIIASGAGRIVALSSTSVSSKRESPDPGERQLAAQLEKGEEALKAWAGEQGIDWVILRPTMIYGRGRDHNVSSLLRFIRKYGFLPVLGPGEGLRQPVHVDDVASAAVAALAAPAAAGRVYDISGGETLSYDTLCRRLFAALERPPRIIRVPSWLLFLARPARLLLPPRLRWLVFMLERMNRDLVFDHSAAAADLGFRPRGFDLTAAELVSDSDRIIP